MRKQVMLEGEVVDLSHDGNGIIKIDQKVYFVPGVLVGERVQFRALKKRKGKYEGALEAILTASEHRIEPACEYFDRCGGCSFLHLDPEVGLLNKEKTLFDNLERIGKVEAQARFHGMQASLWGYRRKARPGIRFVPKKGGIMVGFREPGSSYITSLKHCATLDPRLSALLPSLHELFEKLDHNDRIPQVEVAAGDNAVALVLRHLEPLNAQDVDFIQAYAKDHDVQFFSQSGGLDTIAPLWPREPEPLFYRMPDFDLQMEFAPVDFIQVNAEVNKQMVKQAVDAMELTSADRVLDLFCGLGNFTLPLASAAGEVVGIEADDSLVEKGKRNAVLNGIGNVSFAKCNLHDQDLTHSLDPILSAFGGFNKVLIDPPRSGAYEVVRQLVPILNPDTLVYVSCNPSTLARDADVMVNHHGYDLSKAGVIDMFPHTAHVESMAVFHRR